MRLLTHWLPFASVMCLGGVGCFFTADDDYDGGNEGGFGEICFDDTGYVSGLPASSPAGSADLPELQGTHPLVVPGAIAAGAGEGLLVTIPDSFHRSADFALDANGSLEFVEAINEPCDDSTETFVKGRFRAAMTGGPAEILVTSAGARIASFDISVATATSLDVIPPDTLIVGVASQICAVARSADGGALYADDSLTMSVTSGPADLSILDPGGACHLLTANAAGPITIAVSGLGLQTTLDVVASGS